MQPDREKDCTLAGLGYSFSPVQIKLPGPKPASSSSSAGARPVQQGQLAKAVSFNLKERRPGAAYHSPQLGAAPDAAPPARPRSAGSARPAPQPDLRRSWPALRPDGGDVDSAVQLLQSLKQRVAAQRPADDQPPAKPAPGLARLKESALARRKASSSEVLLAQQHSGGPDSQQEHHTHTFAMPPQGVVDQDASLLHHAEELLAGCSAGAAGEPVHISSPRHMQLVSIPVRAWSQEEGWELEPHTAPSPQQNILWAADVLPMGSAPGVMGEQLGNDGSRIAAYHPAGCKPTTPPVAGCSGEEPSIHQVHAFLSSIRYPPSPMAIHPAASMPALDQGGAASPAVASAAELGSNMAAAGVELGAAPSTLQGALALLGLLGAAEAGGCLPGGGASQPGIVYMAPLWLKLRAAKLVLATKQEAGWQELRPLLARLRHIRTNLEFHKANTCRSRTPPRQRTPVREEPWLSGNSSSSKHMRARSSSPCRQLPPRPKVGPTPQECSELQAKLLSSLLPKLWLKLGVAAMLHAVALERLRQRVLAHIELTEAGKLCILTARGWRAAAIPTAEMMAVAEAFHRKVQQRQKLKLLRAWRAWAEHRRWQQQRVQRGLKVYHHQLRLAALSHWRVYCQERHVQRLQQALAARWLSAWSKRKVFTMWRLVARRAALQKQAMLSRITGGSRACSDADMQLPAGTAGPSLRQLPTLREALIATHTAFGAVKDYVGTAGQELQRLRSGLRFGRRLHSHHHHQQQQEDVEDQPSGSPAPSDPPPLGSLQALLQPHPAAGQGLLTGSVSAQQSPWHMPTANQAQMPVVHSLYDAGWQSAPQDDWSAGQLSPRSPHSSPGWSAIDVGSPGVGLQSPRHSSPPASPAFYNPARYASPTKLPSRHDPEAIQAEMEGHMAAVAHIARELEAFETEMAALQHEQLDLEHQQLATQQQAATCHEGSKAAEQAKLAAAETLQGLIDQHTEASTHYTFMGRQVQQQERQYQQTVGAAAEAKANANAAVEAQAMAAIAAQKWTKKVEVIARELSQCHRTQQPPVAAQLKEARQQLQQHQEQASSAQSQIMPLQQAAQEADECAEEAVQALHAARAQMMAALERRQQLQQEIKALMEAHERHAVEAVAQAQAAASAEQQQRLLAQQKRLGAERLDGITAQVLVRQQDAQQLQQRVAELERLQRQAAATVLAAAKFKSKRSKQQKAGAAAVSAGPPSASLASLPQRPSSLARPAAPLPAAAAPAARALPPCQEPAVLSGATQQLIIAPPACSERSEISSIPSSPRPASLPVPRTVGGAADVFYRTWLLRHSLLALWREAERAREQAALAEQHFAWQTLSKCLSGWKERAAAVRAWLADVQPALRRRGCMRRWAAWVRERKRLRACGEELHAVYCRRLLLQGFLGLRARMDHQQWRDAMHEAVVRLRWCNMLHGWRRWTKQQRVDAASLQKARDVYNKRLLTEAWRQWAWLARNKALVRRVFQTAADLWRDEVGALLHTRNYQLMGETFRTWQLHVLECQEQRRQQILWNAAAAFREKQLYMAGLQAFLGVVHAAEERKHLLSLRAEMFLDWRRLAANSPRHWDWVIAGNQRQKRLLRTAMSAWRATCTDTAHQLATFWLRWQVRQPLHGAFVMWRAMARWQRQQEQQKALALAFRRLMLLRKALKAWSRGSLLHHEKRILRGMAAAYHDKALARKAVAGWRTAAAEAGRQYQRAVVGTDENALSPPARAAPPLQPSNSGGYQAGPRAISTAAPTAHRLSSSPKPPFPRRQHHAMQHSALGTRTLVVVHQSFASPPRAAPPQRLDRQQQLSAGGMAGPRSSLETSHHPEVRAMLQSVEQWKGTAEYWRQRLRADSKPSSPAAPAGMAPAAGVQGGPPHQTASHSSGRQLGQR